MCDKDERLNGKEQNNLQTFMALGGGVAVDAIAIAAASSTREREKKKKKLKTFPAL